jgi:hypothetical protein
MEAECVSEPIWTIWRREICLVPTGNRTPIPLLSSIPLHYLYTNWCNPAPKVISDLHYINIDVICLMPYGALVREYKHFGGIFRVHLQNSRTFTLHAESGSCFDTLLDCGIPQDHSSYLQYSESKKFHVTVIIQPLKYLYQQN